MVMPFCSPNGWRHGMLQILRIVVFGIYAHTSHPSHKVCLAWRKIAAVHQYAVGTTPVPVALKPGQRQLQGQHNLVVIGFYLLHLQNTLATQVLGNQLAPYLPLILNKWVEHTIDDSHHLRGRNTDFCSARKQETLHFLCTLKTHRLGLVCPPLGLRECYRVVLILHQFWWHSVHLQTTGNPCSSL